MEHTAHRTEEVLSSGESRPFFSVCTEVTNRAPTIARTIASIAAQTFRDFEYIIVNNCSDDASSEVIREALAQSPLADVAVRSVDHPARSEGIAAWNGPLHIARGRYIIVCEGDDWFASDHFARAAACLTAHPDVGLYVANRGDLDAQSAATRYGVLRGVVPATVLFTELIAFRFCPPPSEAIFRRTCEGRPFLYDAERFVYAGEYGLYDALLRSGFHGYIDTDAPSVFRGPSTYQKTLFHLRDAYTCLRQWRGDYVVAEDALAARITLWKRSVGLLRVEYRRHAVELALVAHVLREGGAIAMRAAWFHRLCGMR